MRRPRVPGGLERHFESALLPLFARRTPEVNDVLPVLYLHGLALGDFKLTLRGLFGEGAPLSASTVARVEESWHSEAAAWQERSLAELDLVYVPVGRRGVRESGAGEGQGGAAGGDRRAGRRAQGVNRAAQRVPGVDRELEGTDARRRATRLRCPRVVIGDGHLGIWAALPEAYPDADEQRCWNLNVLDQVLKRSQGQAKGN